MGRPPEYDRVQVLEAAKNLFWEQGYEATSIDDLVTGTGLGRSSLYQAFGSKRALFDATLERYTDENLGWVLAQMEAAPPGIRAIERFFEVFEEHAADPERDIGAGCLMICAVQELARRDEGVAAHGANYREAFQSAFARQLEIAVERGEIPVMGVEDRARLLVVLVMGMNAYLRGNQDREAMVAAIRAIRHEVSGWRKP